MRILNKSIYIILISLISFPILSQTRIPSEKPKIIVGIVIENLKGEYLTRFENKFGKNGFSKLTNEGTKFSNTSFDYLITQSGPGIASMMTGSSPSVHGIVANYWYDRNREEYIDCCSDENFKSVGSDIFSGKVSPGLILTTSFSDELKLMSKNKSKVVSISTNYRSAIIAGGHTANSAYWFDDKSGNWMTGNYYMETLPLWVNDFNAKKLPEIYLQNEWNTLLPLEKYTESLNDENPYEIGFGKGEITFPYDLTKLNKGNSDYNLLLQTPYGNSFVKDFALETIINMEMGKDDDTDVLFLTFSAFANIEKIFGSESVEMEDAFLRFDEEIEHFLNFIDNQVGRENALIFLTSDCNSMPNQEYLKDNKFPVNTFNASNSTVLLKAYLNAIYGAGDWVQKYDNKQVYLNQPLIEDAGLSINEVREKTVQLFLQMSGVAKAISANDLQRFDYTSGVFSEVQNSYYPKRSGDVFIYLEPGWVELNPGSLNDQPYKSEPVPLIWYGWKVKRASVNRKISIFDIAPTISGFLEIPFPSGCEGRILPELLD